MTIDRNAQVRSDLDVADSILEACWDNFTATEPTYVIRDLIVVELGKARENEREECAKVAEQLMRDFGDLKYSTDQPMGSFKERFACGQVAKAIRDRS